MTPPSVIAAGCAAVARLMAGSTDPWWIIGSAAVALHGGAPLTIGDIDVLASASDAAAALRRAGMTPAAGVADDRFRSAVFGRIETASLPLEIMGELTVRTPTGWSPVRPLTRIVRRCGDVSIYLPDRSELIAILHAFGRPKDLARAASLELQE